jgi:hypothetical protein
MAGDLVHGRLVFELRRYRFADRSSGAERRRRAATGSGAGHRTSCWVKWMERVRVIVYVVFSLIIFFFSSLLSLMCKRAVACVLAMFHVLASNVCDYCITRFMLLYIFEPACSSLTTDYSSTELDVLVVCGLHKSSLLPSKPTDQKYRYG